MQGEVPEKPTLSRLRRCSPEQLEALYAEGAELAFTHLPIGVPYHVPFIFLALLTTLIQALVFMLRTPLPRRRKVRPELVPAGIFARTGPWIVPTSISPPR